MRKRRKLAGFLLLFPISAWSVLPSADEIIQQAVSKKLFEQPAWHALTHSDGNKAAIETSSFLLSAGGFSSRAELTRTIEVLYAQDHASAGKCTYPARNAWIAEQLGITPASLDHCRDLHEFLARAPADQVTLVYASENLSQPSSTMGHIFLKISGHDDQGHHREHAVTFFTVIDGINVPKIIFDSLVVGKEGYFALSPYEEKVKTYLAGEQRNIWEYQLDLTDRQRKLLQLHIWELKSANPTYYFDSYNCATLTNYILATANPAMLDQGSYFLSPLDVVKNINRHDMISDVVVLPSSKWKIRMIAGGLSPDTNRKIKSSVDAAHADELPHMQSQEEQFLARSLAETYNDYLYETGDRTVAEWSDYEEQLASQSGPGDDEYLIDLSQYKNPLKTPRDGQWYIGPARVGDENYVRVGVLPVSHTLSDDNSQFFSETELRLADISLLVSAEDGGVELNEMQIYSTSSFLPRNLFTGGISGTFRIGIEPHYDNQLDRKMAGNISGGIGATFEPIQNLSVFAIVNLGLGYRAGESGYLYAAPEIGVILDEALDMKTVLAVSRTIGQIDPDFEYTSISLRQSKRLNSTYTIVIDGVYFHGNGKTSWEYGATLKYLF